MEYNTSKIQPAIPPIFFASRSHPAYLKKLREISNREEELHIISITGGLAFLHAMSERTQTLKLVDCSSEVNNYAKIIIELILACESRQNFFGVLSGYHFIESYTGECQFVCDSFEDRDLILSSIAPLATKAIKEWYPIEAFDVTTATTTTKFDVISFLVQNFCHAICNWMLGFGCFQSEKSYACMRNALIRLKPEFITSKLEDFPYSQCKGQTLVLASNTDSPLFTTNDVVLESIIASKNDSIHYVSRTRDFSIPWEPLNSYPQFTEQNRFYAIYPEVLYPDDVLLELGGNWKLLSFEEYFQNLYYSIEGILFDLKFQPDIAQFLLSSFKEIIPLHRMIILASVPEDIVSQFTELLSKTYSVTNFTTRTVGEPGIPLLTCELRNSYL